MRESKYDIFSSSLYRLGLCRNWYNVRPKLRANARTICSKFSLGANFRSNRPNHLLTFSLNTHKTLYRHNSPRYINSRAATTLRHPKTYLRASIFPSLTIACIISAKIPLHLPLRRFSPTKNSTQHPLCGVYHN